jgi:NADH-quinone oxidoreductase subunit M
MGAYGFLRFSLPMLPEASMFFQPLIFFLSVVAIIYTSLVALAQEDMKKLIAYSSVAHMGFVTIGIFTVSVKGVEGALFQMLSHGIISSALFLCVGVVYDRIHSRDISRYGGLVHRMPAYALVFMVFTLGALGLPGTSGFIGEFLSLLAAFQTNRLVAVLASTGVVLGAVYMLWLYGRVMLGQLNKEDLKSILDLNRREVAIFTPLVLLVLWMGIYPEYFLVLMHTSTNNLVENFEIARSTHLTTLVP